MDIRETLSGDDTHIINLFWTCLAISSCEDPAARYFCPHFCLCRWRNHFIIDLAKMLEVFVGQQILPQIVEICAARDAIYEKYSL